MSYIDRRYRMDGLWFHRKKNVAQKNLIIWYGSSDWYLTYIKIGVNLPWTYLYKEIYNCDFLSKLALKFINLNAKLLKNRKFSSKRLMSSIKMIQKWALCAMQCYAGKNPDKNGHFSPLCTAQTTCRKATLNFYILY